MLLFQNNGLSRGFRAHFSHKKERLGSFAESLAAFLDTRFSALHILKPVLAGDSNAFYTNGDNLNLQSLWAQERGLLTDDLEKILLAQIEHHRTDVFYNLDPMRYDSAFVKKLPGCVKTTVCWRAAPSGNLDLTGYDLVICNFPSILETWRGKGCKAKYFSPAYDPAMDEYVDVRRNDLDLIFVGGFSRHHASRNVALRTAASIPDIRMRFHVEDSRLTQLANVLWFMPFLTKYRHPREIREVRAGPLYGRDLYAALAKARIVLNGAVDMAGEDRGNMRCFEALGCGAVLLTDSGRYPEGFVDGETMVTYSSSDQISTLTRRLIADESWANSIAKAGRILMRDRYSKERQWTRFQELI
jgi:hypothetical protein